MKPIDRVKKIIDFYSISVSAFEKSAGLSNNSIQTALKRRSNLKDKTLNSILIKYSNINPTWLLIGEGEMLKKEDTQDKFVLELEKKQLEDKINLLENTIKDKEEIISFQKSKIENLKADKKILKSKLGKCTNNQDRGRERGVSTGK